MNNSSKSHKDITLPIGSTNKLKIITNGNGTSSVITTSTTSNGKNRNRSSKNILPAASTLELFTYVSFCNMRSMCKNENVTSSSINGSEISHITTQRLNGSKSGATSDHNGSTSTTLKLSKSSLKPMFSSGGGSGSGSTSSTVAKQIATQQLMLSKHQQRQLKPNSENSNSVNNNNNSTNKNNNNQARLGGGNDSGNSSSSIGGSIGKSFGLKRNSPSIHQSARSFQYESFHVFDWRDYLIVSINCRSKLSISLHSWTIPDYFFSSSKTCFFDITYFCKCL